jgi:hypothetical protein
LLVHTLELLMQSDVFGKRSPNLYRVLIRARNSWWRTAGWTTFLTGLLAAGLAVLCFWLVAWWSESPGALVAAGSSSVARVGVTLLGVTGLVALAGLVIAALVRPSLLEFARRLDSRLGQSQRLATAFEVLEAGGPDTVVSHALIADVERRSEGLDARTAGRSNAVRPLARAAVAAAILGIAALLVPVPVLPTSAGATVDRASSPATAPDGADVAAVSELAHVLELVAERAENDYLRAVAGSFTEFSEQLARGEISGAEADRTSQELAEHLLAAARDVGGAFQQAIEASLGGASGSSADMAALRDVALAEDAVEAQGDAPVSTPTSVQAREQPPSIYMGFEKIVAEYEYDPSTLGLAPEGANRGVGEPDADFYGGVLNAQQDPNATPPEAPFAGRVQGQGGGEMAGAAERSSDRAGDAAGAGGADLGAGAASPASAGSPGVAVAALPRNENELGQFTEVEMLPGESQAAVRLPLTSGSPAMFTRAQESSSSSRGIGGTYKDVVARYFTPVGSTGTRQ